MAKQKAACVSCKAQGGGMFLGRFAGGVWVDLMEESEQLLELRVYG